MDTITLENIERENGFVEATKDHETGKTKKFFNLGPKNNWKNILDDEIRNSIENEFRIEMKCFC